MSGATSEEVPARNVSDCPCEGACEHWLDDEQGCPHATVTDEQHAPTVDGGPRYFGWVCGCGKRSSKHWASPFEAAYAGLVHVRNPDGPS